MQNLVSSMTFNAFICNGSQSIAQGAQRAIQMARCKGPHQTSDKQSEAGAMDREYRSRRPGFHKRVKPPDHRQFVSSANLISYPILSARSGCHRRTDVAKAFSCVTEGVRSDCRPRSPFPLCCPKRRESCFLTSFELTVSCAAHADYLTTQI